MDVFAVTNVDAYVICAAAPEYEVARLKITEGHWCCCSLLAVGDTWDGDAIFSVNILNQAAAVKAAWAGAAPYIWHANVFHGCFNDLFTDALFDVSSIDAVCFERFPNGAVVYFDEHEVVVMHGDHAVGQFLDEGHWCVGGVVNHFNIVIVAVCCGGDGSAGFVIVKLRVTAGSGEFELAFLFVWIGGYAGAKRFEGAAQRQIKGAFFIDNGCAQLVVVNMVITGSALQGRSLFCSCFNRCSVV